MGIVDPVDVAVSVVIVFLHLLYAFILRKYGLSAHHGAEAALPNSIVLFHEWIAIGLDIQLVSIDAPDVGFGRG